MTVVDRRVPRRRVRASEDDGAFTAEGTLYCALDQDAQLLGWFSLATFSTCVHYYVAWAEQCIQSFGEALAAAALPHLEKHMASRNGCGQTKRALVLYRIQQHEAKAGSII